MIVIESDGITPVLDLMVERMDDAREPLSAILSDALLRGQEQVLEGKGSMFGGSAWPEMAPATVKRGRDPSTLLFEHGMLFQSMTRGATGNIFDVGPTEGEAGTNLTSPKTGYGYAAGQQRGAPNARRPPRPYLEWFAERFGEYDRLMADWILGEVWPGAAL